MPHLKHGYHHGVQPFKSKFKICDVRNGGLGSSSVWLRVQKDIEYTSHLFLSMPTTNQSALVDSYKAEALASEAKHGGAGGNAAIASGV